MPYGDDDNGEKLDDNSRNCTSDLIANRKKNHQIRTHSKKTNKLIASTFLSFTEHTHPNEYAPVTTDKVPIEEQCRYFFQKTQIKSLAVATHYGLCWSAN